MGASLGNGKGFVAEINVTPFVDVMLVLLIIFMVTAPMMTEGLEVQLPQTRTVDKLPTDNESVVLTLRKDGVLFLNTTQTTMENLDIQLKTVVLDQQKVLFLQADRDVSYGDVVRIMGYVKAAGINDLGLVAQQEDAPPQPPAGQQPKAR